MTEQEELLQKAREKEERTFEVVINNEDGQQFLKYLENYILHKAPYYEDDISKDALLREGGRILLTHIKLMSGN